MFKLRLSDAHAVFGQLLDYCEKAAAQQPGRTHMYCVAIFMDCVEVFRCTTDDGDVAAVQRSGVKPLAISPTSAGLRLLTRIFQASRQQLGYEMPSLEPPIMLDGQTLTAPELLAAGADLDNGNLVFGVTLPTGARAVLKLTDKTDEVTPPRNPLLFHPSCITIVTTVRSAPPMLNKDFVQSDIL